MNSHLKGLLIAFFGILILTPDAVLVRLADSNSWTVLFWRGLFFAAGILVILLITYRSKAVNELINIGKEGVLIGLLTGLGGTSFILAIHYTSIAKTLVIITISPIMVAIVSLIMLKEKPALYTWLSMILVFFGIYIVMAGDTSGTNLMGNLFALAAVVIGGFSFTLLRKYKNVKCSAWTINPLLRKLKTHKKKSKYISFWNKKCFRKIHKKPRNQKKNSTTQHLQIF